MLAWRGDALPEVTGFPYWRIGPEVVSYSRSVIGSPTMLYLDSFLPRSHSQGLVLIQPTTAPETHIREAGHRRYVRGLCSGPTFGLSVETNSTDSAPLAAEDSLQAALARHGIAVPAEQMGAMEAYARLLWEWNEKLNLTRHTTWEKFVARDVVDARQLAEQIPAGDRVLDVGTGGGVPGILLAILRPDLHVELCDPVGKKARAVAEIVAGLGMPLPVHGDRVERVLERQPFDTLVVRAVAPLWELLSWLAPLWKNIGQLLVIKGPKWLDERGHARHRGYLKPLELRKVAEYPLPGTESNSVILKVWRPESAA